MITKKLILGGARSGKSSHAEKTALDLAGDQAELTYIATATAGDTEMLNRIEHHKARRGSRWTLIEEPINLAKRINNASVGSVVLIDCLTLWLSNCLHQNNWLEQRDALLKAVISSDTNIILVSNEVGSGIVPVGELSRQFVDESGSLHQMLAEHCNLVTLVVAGLPMSLKGGE